MTNKKSPTTPSPSTAKSTPKTGKTSTDCITLKSDDIMKSDITSNSVDPAMPVNTANSDVAVNSNDRDTPDNTANLFNDEPTATPQPKQQRVGIKQRKLEFGEYIRSTSAMPHGSVLNVTPESSATVVPTSAAMPSASSASTSTCSATTLKRGANSEN